MYIKNTTIYFKIVAIMLIVVLNISTINLKSAYAIAPNSVFSQNRPKFYTIVFKPIEFSSKDLLADNKIRLKLNLYIAEYLYDLGYRNFEVAALSGQIYEGVKNALVHGNRYQADKKAVVKTQVVDNTLTVIIEDEGGIVFNFREYTHPLLSQSFLRETRAFFRTILILFKLSLWPNTPKNQKKLLSGMHQGVNQMSKYFDYLKYHFKPHIKTYLVLKKDLGPPKAMSKIIRLKNLLPLSIESVSLNYINNSA